MPEPHPRAGPESRLGVVLEEKIVAVIPDIDKGVAVHLYKSIDQGGQIDPAQQVPVEPGQPDPRLAQDPQGAEKEQKVRPETQKREEQGPHPAPEPQQPQQEQRAGKERRAEPGPAAPEDSGWHEKIILSRLNGAKTTIL